MNINKFTESLLKGFQRVPALQKHSYVVLNSDSEPYIGVTFNPSGIQHAFSVNDMYKKYLRNVPIDKIINELVQNLIMLNNIANHPDDYTQPTPEMEGSVQLCVVSESIFEKCNKPNRNPTTCTVHGVKFAFYIKEGSEISIIEVPGFVNNSKDIQSFYRRAVDNMLRDFELVIEPVPTNYLYSIRVKDELGITSGLLASVRLLKKVSELPEINGSFYAIVLFNVFIVMPAVTSSESEQLLMRKAVEVAMQGQDADKILAFYNCVTNKVTILSNSFKTNVGRSVI